METLSDIHLIIQCIPIALLNGWLNVGVVFLFSNKPSSAVHNLNGKGVAQLANKKEKVFLVVVIEGSVIKRIMILDIIVGSGIYYALQWMCSSIIISMIGSMIGTEGIKKAQKQRKNPNIKLVRVLKTIK